MTKLPNFAKLAPDGVPELYLDHTLLSSARMCESRFILEYVQNYRSKGSLPWPLAFGIVFHDCMEEFYHKQMTGSFDFISWLKTSASRWEEAKLDSYAAYPQYKSVGGYKGFIGLLSQYHEFYTKSKDNLTPIALEIPFGKAKEVPLLLDHTEFSYAPFRLYLAGRMDYIFDDGKRLGPMDHKTFSMAGKNPMTTYEVQEGMTGYIYAMSFIYKKLKLDFEEANPGKYYERDTNVLWLNFILTKAEQDLNKRFQRMPLYKTQWQLEEWRLRQISTAAKIYQLVFEQRPPDFNTSVCTNYWHSTCTFQPLHRLASRQDQEILLSREFTVAEEWNPERLVQIAE